MLLDNSDGTDIVPSSRKIFMEKFRKYIMDNCILDMVSQSIFTVVYAQNLIQKLKWITILCPIMNNKLLWS